jgi:aldose 1-epimerase
MIIPLVKSNFPHQLSLNPERFAALRDAKPVALYTLRNANGVEVCICNYGAKIIQILLPDRDGKWLDVALGYDSLEALEAGAPSMGAFVGRYAGRIENARFTLDGKLHQLSVNNGPHCLHGGLRGSRFRVFQAQQSTAASVTMRYTFADGEEGFPGAMTLSLTYTLTDANDVILDYQAEALDQTTVANLTTHGYFNLDGEGAGSVLAHSVEIHADQYFEMQPDLIPSGEILNVFATAHDLRTPTILSTVVGDGKALNGFDDCFLIKRADYISSEQPVLCARVSSALSGIAMEAWSTEPTLQFYTGLKPQEALLGGPGKSGQTYRQQHGFCLEPQGYPNAPNLPQFPSAALHPGQPRVGRTVYRFGLLKT